MSLLSSGTQTEMTLGQAAAKYAQAGLSVLPWAVSDGEKTPQKPWAVNVLPPMTVPEVVRWWRLHPDHNVGVITGPTGTTHTGALPAVRQTDIVGLDLDSARAIAWAECNLPDTPWVTRSGREGVGEHRVYRYPTDLPPGRYIANRTAIEGVPGLDIRAKGGYLAMPPSVHKSGRTYRWIAQPVKVADLPVLDLRWFSNDILNNQAEDVPTDQIDAPDSSVALAAAWLTQQPPAVENKVSPGSNGERHTYTICAKLRRGFLLSAKQALDVMQEWNRRCQPPWEQEGLLRKLEHAYDSSPEQLGGMVAADAVDRLVPTPQPLTPTTAMPPAVVDALRAATQLLAELPGLVVDDPGVPYTDKYVAAALLVRSKAMADFVRIKEELKAVKVSVKDWEKHLLASQREAVVQRLEHPPANRPQVIIHNDELQMVTAILEAMAKAPSIFYYNDGLVDIQGSTVTPLRRDATRNAILHACSPCKMDTKTGVKVITQLPLHLVGMVDGALPSQLKEFRRVRSVVRTPFCTPNAATGTYRLVTVPCYDAPTQTLLPETPEIRLENFPTVADALHFLEWIFSDFPFDSKTDWAHYLGALVLVVARRSINGPTPLHVIEASQERGGKTLLAKVLMLLAGMVPQTTEYPDKADLVPQAIFASVRNMHTVHVWDNASGVIDSPAMALALTATVFGGRILRTSDTIGVPCEQIWVLTSNNALLSHELAKRSIRTRLLTGPSADRRSVKIPDLLEYVTKRRNDILSALCRLVQHWIDVGAPKAPSAVWLEGYEAYVRVVGGIMHACGVNAWLSNRQADVRRLAAHSDWEPYCHAWWDKHGDKPAQIGALHALCTVTGLMGAIVGDGNAQSQLTRLGVQLRKQHQAYHGEYQILAVEQRANSTMYRLQKINVIPLNAECKAA